MQWKIDPSHSSVEFGVRHLGFANVRGHFRTFEGSVETDSINLPVYAEARIATASVDTNEPRRDEHLRSAEGLDATDHPEILFRSTAITAGTPNDTDLLHYEIDGELTIRGITQPVHFKASVTSPLTDHNGATRVAAEVTGVIKRAEWGIEFSHNPLVNNALLIGEEVYFHFHLQTLQQGG